jgi:hypothetical protein
MAPLALAATLALAACGGGSGDNAQVASIGNTGGESATGTTAPANTQEALLAYAACMRQNGVDMADPTFDANGEPTGGLFGPESGINPRSEEFQAAQQACGGLIQGITLGGGNRRFDTQAIQDALNDFTACLRDHGLDVDDITFGGGQGPGGNPGGGFGGGNGVGNGNGTNGNGNGSTQNTTGGSNGATPPPGGFGGRGGNGGNGGNGAGFDPTERIIDQLGLDKNDPAVTSALSACQPILTAGFQPTTTTTAP